MHKISLSNIEFEGSNNAYLLDDGDELILIDTGLFSPDIYSELKQKISERGYNIKDITNILLTHWHADHSGLSGTIQKESGADVYCHKYDSPLITKKPSAFNELIQLTRDKFNTWHIPQSKFDPLFKVLEIGHKLGGISPNVIEFENGDTISLGTYSFSIIHVPGHTSGLSCFVMEGTNNVFVGDAVLPVYTPNIGGADLRVTSSLSKYYKSLLHLKTHNFDTFYPGHRHIIEKPNQRIEEILQHHRDRFNQIISLLLNAPLDIWSISTQIFGSLDGIHVLYGAGEIHAHLEYLESFDIVESHDGVYRLIISDILIEDIF